MRLRSKLLLLLSLVVLPAIVSGVVLYRSLSQTYEDAAVARLRDNVTQAAGTIDEFVHTRAEDLRVLSLDPLFWLGTDDETSAYLTRRVALFPHYRAFYHTDNNGVIVAASERAAIGQSLFRFYPALRDDFQHALSAPPDALFATALNNQSIQFLSGIADREGKTEGVLVGDVDTRVLRELVGDLDVRSAGDEHAYILRPDGDVAVAGIDDDGRVRRHPDSDLDLLHRALGASTHDAIIYTNAAGRSVITAYAPISSVGNEQEGGQLLVSTAVYRDVMAPLREHFALAGWTIGLVCLVAVFVAGFSASRLARRIGRLARIARECDDGRVAPMVGVTGHDEVGEVAVAFNKMASRIVERTTELSNANQALRAEKQTLSQSQRLGHVGTWFYEMTDSIAWSEEMYRLFGVSPEAFVPTPESLILAIHPDDRPAMQSWLAACAAGERPGGLDFRVTWPDGGIRFLRGTGEAVFDGANRVVHMAGTVVDVTERVEREAILVERARLSALAGDVGTSLSSARSMRDALQGCAAALVQHLDAAFARVWTLNEKTCMLELQASAGMYTHLDGAHGRVPVGKFKIGLIAAERQPHLTNEVLGDPRVGDQEWAAREGMVSFAGYPLIVGDRVVGVMALFARHPLADLTLQAMASIADGMAVGVERMRADAALRESEERFRDLFDNSNDLIQNFRPDGRFVYVNRSWHLALGYTDEEVAGLTIFDVIHPDSLEHCSAEFQRLMSGENVVLEAAFRAKDGRKVWVEGNAHCQVKNGQPIATRGIFRDVTARKRADEERTKFVALIENSADFVGMATLEGAPFYLNKAGRDMVGLGPEVDVASIPLTECFDPATAAMVHQTVLPAVFEAGKWAGEGSLRHLTTQALIPVHMHALLVRDPASGEPICIATIQRDIREIREAESRLEVVNRELREVSRLSGMAEVATSVLHNVGNVLNSVNVSADLIAEKVSRLKPSSLEKVAAMLGEHVHDLPEFLTHDPRGKELPGYLRALFAQLADPQKDIVPEVASLRRNIEHIREIVRLQQNYGKAVRTLDAVPIAELAEDAVRINAAAFARNDVRVVREYLPVPVFPIDKHQVLQILVNLLSNASHAIVEGRGPERTVTLRIEATSNGTVKVSVSDTGIGIAPENLTRIFQHGFTTRAGGHGFGLHSGALAANELGGSLTASSNGPGQGAVFTLELPHAVSEQAA